MILPRRHALCSAALCVGLIGVWMALPSWAAPSIYSCVNAKGQRITSDRPIPECLDRPQEVRSNDGAVRKVVQPSMTADERAAQEERLRQDMAAEAARRDAMRRDRNLMNRYPDEARHLQARTAALAPLQAALDSTAQRIQQLEQDKTALLSEAEFYKGKTLPREIKLKLDQNQVALQAQRDAVLNHQSEWRRINASYDQELGRLRQLWAGAAPGSGTTASR